MALKLTINSNLNTNGVLSPPPNKLHSHLLPSNNFFCGRRILGSTPLSLTRSKRSWHGSLRVSNLSQSSASNSFDVVIVGAGIIGLTIARHLLLASDLSVAIVDAAVPCSGATGAGQGYIWKAHKSPGSEKWELMMRSHQLWENLAKSVQLQGLDPLEVLGWKKTGSLLVSKTADESAMLKKRVEELSQEGLRAEFLSTNDLLSEEPELVLEKEGGAAFFPDDYQLDAHRTVAFIEKANRRFAVEGRYAEFYHDPVIGLVRPGNSCKVGAIQTSKNTLHSKRAVVIAAGCWTGSLMHDLIKQPDIELDLPIKPRKGHLLVIENFKLFKLNHGIMEAGYANHQSATLKATASDSGPVYNAQDLSVSMTATMDASGNLVLDDTILFCSGEPGSMKMMMKVLRDYEQVSGQMVNLIKCFVYLHEKVPNAVANKIKRITGVRQGSFPFTYLGCPIYYGRTNIHFEELIKKPWKRTMMWENKLLSFGGRYVLISHVLPSMLIYLLSTMNPSKRVIDQLHKIFAKFYWSNITRVKSKR